MATETLQRLAILASPLAPSTAGEALSSDQWTTLLAIADAFVPPIQSSSAVSTSALSLAPSEYTKLTRNLTKVDRDAHVLHDYLAERASLLPGFKDLVGRLLGDYSRSDARKSTSILLTALGYRPLLQIKA